MAESSVQDVSSGPQGCDPAKLHIGELGLPGIQVRQQATQEGKGNGKRNGLVWRPRGEEPEARDPTQEMSPPGQ